MAPAFVPLNDIREMKRSNSHGSNKDLQVLGEGDEDSRDFRLHTTDSTGQKISLWHDVNLTHMYANKQTPDFT